MADSKISDLTALSSPADDDVFAIVDTDAGQTKKITAANVKTYAGSSTEAIQDIVGAMFSSNTETDITATYEDGDGTIDLVVSVSAGNLPTAIDAAKIGDGSVSNTEFQRLDGVSSDIQTQLDGKQASLTFGIGNTNIPIFTSGVADDDFLRVAGTSIEGRSASEVLSDIGGQAALTFGISNTNAVKIDSSSVADDEYARFTANGLESRSTAEVLSDIGGITASSTDTLTNKTIDADGTGNSITNIENANIKASAAIDATKIADGSVTSAEFQHLGSVTSDIQTQIDAKASKGLAVAMAIAL
jgi:hypothetical protein